MARSLKLSWAASHYRYGHDDGVRIRFDVTCATGLSNKIFAYRMFPVGPDGQTVGTYSHVCSPVDLEEYPADEPVAPMSPEWFRLSYVDVLVRSVEEANNFVEVVSGDVDRLVATLATMDILIPQGTKLIGEDCEEYSESSSSASDSSASSASYGSLNSVSAIGTDEQNVGFGVLWVNTGEGAGSPIGSSDSLAANRSSVMLCKGEASALLLVRGFDFSELSDDCVIEGIEARVTLRDTADPASSSSSASSMASLPAQCPRLSLLSLQHPLFGMSENKADHSCVEGPAWNTQVYGGSTDLWGFPAVVGEQLKDGAFGIGLVIDNTFSTLTSTTEVDGVELIVYFREVI